MIRIYRINTVNLASDSSLWSDDNRKWPSVEFGSVYVYLIDTQGPFTRENMQAYKSLNDFFVDGWVHTCFMRSSKTGFCSIKGKVNRSQAVTDKPQTPGVIFLCHTKLRNYKNTELWDSISLATGGVLNSSIFNKHPITTKLTKRKLGQTWECFI